MPDDNMSKKDRRDAARQERQAAEQAAAATAARKRRLSILGGVVGAVAVVVIAIVLATSGGGGDDDTSAPPAGGTVAGVSESTAMLSGVPQSGLTLGDPDAPVTMREFADLQCPFCRDFALQTLPRVVQDYVRTGKVKIELHLMTFLGPDSIRGAQVANLAAKQDKLWNFTELFFHNQGEEQTGYADDAFLRKLAAAAPGLDTGPLFASPISDTPTAADRKVDELAQQSGVTGTPSFTVGPTGGPLKLVSGFDYDTIKAALDAAAPAT